MINDQVVYLVECDDSERNYLTRLLHREALTVQAYSSPPELLTNVDFTRTGCLVVAMNLTETTGLELCQQLVQKGCPLPFLIIADQADLSDAIRAMRLGAVDFQLRPIDEKSFLNRVYQALVLSTQFHRRQAKASRVQRRMESLTTREREVLNLVVEGLLTKQIAKKLDVSIKTVEAHRSNINRKMGVESTVQLVRSVLEYVRNRERGRLHRWPSSIWLRSSPPHVFSPSIAEPCRNHSN